MTTHDLVPPWRHYDADTIPWEVDGAFHRAMIVLNKNESAWNPASTRHAIWGPARVTYIQYPDGGVNAKVEAEAVERADS